MATQIPSTLTPLPRFDNPDAALLSSTDLKTFDSMKLALMRRRDAGYTDFIHRLALFLPEIAANIDESDFGVLHLEMGVLTQATRAAITRSDFDAIHRHFAFISHLFEFANAELLDAIRISYLENLLLGETSQRYVETRYLLPEHLEIELRKLEARFGLSKIIH